MLVLTISTSKYAFFFTFLNSIRAASCTSFIIPWAFSFPLMVNISAISIFESRISKEAFSKKPLHTLLCDFQDFLKQAREQKDSPNKHSEMHELLHSSQIRGIGCLSGLYFPDRAIIFEYYSINSWALIHHLWSFNIKLTFTESTNWEEHFYPFINWLLV